MDKNAYQRELNDLRFTPAGRAALTAGLLAQAKASDRRRFRPRRWLAAAVAAAVLAGTAAAAAGPLWERYFGRLDEEQQTVIDSLSQQLPAAESNGTVMTPLAAFGDQDFYYLMLEIQAPEGTVLPDYEEDEGYYQLFRDTAEDRLTLTDEAGQQLPCQVDFTWMSRDGRENVLTAALRLWSMDSRLDFSDGTDKFLCVPGLWVQTPDKNYTPVLTGRWDFNIGAHTGGTESRMLDTSNVTTQDENYGTLTMASLRLSPLGLRFRYSWSAPAEEGCPFYPGAVIAAVMEDGSEILLANSMGSYQPEECWSETYGPFETPIDLEHVTAVRWGDARIPVN